MLVSQLVLMLHQDRHHLRSCLGHATSLLELTVLLHGPLGIELRCVDRVRSLVADPFMLVLLVARLLVSLLRSTVCTG